MAWGSIGTLSTVAYAGNNQTSMVHTIGANSIQPGNFAVIAWAQDNYSSVGSIDSAIITTVNDSAGNVWRKAKEWQSGGGAVQGGAVCSVWYTNATVALASGTGTITATLDSSFTANFDAGASAGWVYSVGGAVYVLNSTASISATSVPGLLDLNSGATGPYLRVRGIASETTLTTDISTTSGWTALGTVRASGTKAMGVRAEWIITASSTAASNPGAVGTAAIDQASVYVIFAETAPAVGAAQGDADATGIVVGTAQSPGLAQGDAEASGVLSATALFDGLAQGDSEVTGFLFGDGSMTGTAVGDAVATGIYPFTGGPLDDCRVSAINIGCPWRGLLPAVTT